MSFIRTKVGHLSSPCILRGWSSGWACWKPSPVAVRGLESPHGDGSWHSGGDPAPSSWAWQTTACSPARPQVSGPSGGWAPQLLKSPPPPHLLEEGPDRLTSLLFEPLKLHQLEGTECRDCFCAPEQ